MDAESSLSQDGAFRANLQELRTGDGALSGVGSYRDGRTIREPAGIFVEGASRRKPAMCASRVNSIWRSDCVGGRVEGAELNPE
jgi:hypothetical protein